MDVYPDIRLRITCISVAYSLLHLSGRLMRLSLLYATIASYLPAMLEPYGSGHMITHTMSWYKTWTKMEVIAHKSPLSSPTYVNIWWEYCIGISCLDIPLAYPILIRYFKGFIPPVFGLKAQMNPTSYHMELDLRFTLLNVT